MIFSVAYSTNIDKAKAAIQKVFDAHELVLTEPAAFIEVDTLGESSVNIISRPFCKGEHYFDLRYSLPQLVKQEFDKQKIKIPFPHRVMITEK